MKPMLRSRAALRITRLSIFRAAVISALVLCLAPVASAGKRPFTWVWDAEVLREGEVELEQWLWSKRNTQMHIGYIWFAPVIGVTNQLELAFPWEIMGGSGTPMKMANMAGEVRYLWTNPLTEGRRFHFLTRGFLQQNFNDGRDGRNTGPLDTTQWWGLNLVTAYGDLNGSHVTLDLGHMMDLGPTEHWLRIATASLGYVHRVRRGLLLGGEVFFERGLPGYKEQLNNLMAGPVINVFHKNYWITVGALTGVRKDQDTLFMPRFMFGVTL
ncbi:MAG TPA: hypothetical protein PLZ57_09815 [Pseudobdellovibrionaceae bacterium]|nr:hypothetical protein [Pseudobdellovibrionaceae bacterium]